MIAAIAAIAGPRLHLGATFDRSLVIAGSEATRSRDSLRSAGAAVAAQTATWLRV